MSNVTQEQLVEDVRRQWNFLSTLPLEDGEEPESIPAVSFVLAGRNKPEVVAHAAKIAHLFQEITGVLCLYHVVNVAEKDTYPVVNFDGHGIETVMVPADRWNEVNACLVMLDEGLKSVYRSQSLELAEAGV